MSVRTIETTGLQVYSGRDVLKLPKKLRHDALIEIHGGLGRGKEQGHMHQPPLLSLRESMEAGDFVLAMQGDRVVATAHLRGAKSGPNNRELGGVMNLGDVQRAGFAAVVAGVQLATDSGAEAVEALVAEKNLSGLRFFRQIGASETGHRPSDYVRDPATEEFASMIIFDLSMLVERT